MASSDIPPESVDGLTSPPGFVFGAVTAAYQIEGADRLRRR
jgi:beta-glucosidase